MITAVMRAEMRRLVLIQGWRIETVARRYGVHHSVVRRALRDDAGERRAPTSALDPIQAVHRRAARGATAAHERPARRGAACPRL